MIKELTMYTVICDRCGVDSNAGNEIIGWSDKLSAVDVAIDSGFKYGESQKDSHYCPDCYDNLYSETETP